MPAARMATQETWSADSVSSMADIIIVVTPRYVREKATQSRSHTSRASLGELEASSSTACAVSCSPVPRSTPWSISSEM